MMETGDAEEYEQVLMSTIKSEVLTSNACKAYFQDNPFSSVLRADGVPPVYSPFAHGFINRFAVLDQKNSIVSSSLSDIQDKMKDLWVNGSLGLMVQKAHCLWRGRYIQCIHEATESSLKKASEKGDILVFARDLFSCAQIESPSRPAFYQALEPVLRKILVGADRATVEGGILSTVDLKAADQPTRDMIVTLRIRDIFSTEEEALILMVIRKYLKLRFGRRVYTVVWPSFHGFAGAGIHPTLAEAPVLPDIPGMFAEVVATGTLEAEDVRYYHKVQETLVKYDSLVEGSVLASQYGFLKIPRLTTICAEDDSIKPMGATGGTRRRPYERVQQRSAS